MKADFVGITTVMASGFDLDFIACTFMIIVGYIIMKKCTVKWRIFLGRLLFGVGYGMFLWMILWQIAPGVMAQVTYGLRI